MHIYVDIQKATGTSDTISYLVTIFQKLPCRFQTHRIIMLIDIVTVTKLTKVIQRAVSILNNHSLCFDMLASDMVEN